MSDPRIVGIAMVRDEDLFVERALRNVLAFCDELIVADNGSTDATPSILERLAGEEPEKVRVHHVQRGGESNELLRPYVGRDVWVLGVDGDELYEPERLAALRPRLLAGELDEWFLVKGNMLHCDELDAAHGTAAGWLAPPSRSTTKLFNFAALERWEGRAIEHLYGGDRRVRPGYSSDAIYWLREEWPWATSPFRCLHVCFLRRSSLQPRRLVARESIIERAGYSRRRRARDRIRPLLGRPPNSDWKLAKYRQGPHVDVDDVAGFFDGAVVTEAS